MEKKIKKIEKSSKIEENINNQKNQDQSNPFIDCFKEISDSNNDMKGLFEGMGGDFSDIFKTLNGGKDNKNASDLMNILNSINETDIKDSGNEMGNMTGIFEQLFDVLLKEDVLTIPLSTISTKLQDYMIKNKEKVTEEDKSKYDQIIKYIQEILLEIKLFRFSMSFLCY